MTFEEEAQLLRDAVRKYTERYSWTDLEEAYLGDGNDPPTVLAPRDKALFKGAVYYYTDPLDNTTVSQAVGFQLGVDLNELQLFAGQPIQVGKPEGSDYTHARVTLNTVQSIGGGSPQQITAARQQLVTPDRYQELRMYADGAGTLTPLMTAGKYRIGNTIINWQGGTTVDLTSFVPATAGRAVYALVMIDDTQQFFVEVGTEFIASPSVDKNDVLPTAARSDSLQLSWVYLENGKTQLTNNDFINIAMIPFISGTGTATPPASALTNHSGTILTNHDGVTLTAGA